MPEQLTKHPEVTLKVLRSAGAQCAEGLPQEILTSCPPARFCKLPGGEICVYGLADAKQMTQLTSADWQSLQSPHGDVAAAFDTPGVGAWLMAVLLAVGVGMGLGAWISRVRRRRR